MNLDDATATLRILATAAGVANPDAVTITVTPYKGNGERSFMKGAKVATATGWAQRFAAPHCPTRSAVPSTEGRNEEAAIAALVEMCREWAESALDAAIADEQRLLDEARKATVAAAALNVEARRAAMHAAK